MSIGSSLKAWAKRIKRDGVTLWFAGKNPATPWYAKALGVFVVAYALSPIDLIPDFIPVLGYLDDVLLLPGLIWLTIKLLPADVLAECRGQADEWMASSGVKPTSKIGAALVVGLWLLLSFIALLALTGTAHAQSFTLQSVELRGKNAQGRELGKGELVMPFVAGEGASGAAAARINDFLYITLAGRLAPRQPVAVLNVQPTEEISGTSELKFSISRNDARLLSLVFDLEGCGAYCEDYQQVYAFEAQTGRVVTAQNLFTPAGKKALSARMLAARAAAYRRQLRALATEMKKLEAAKPVPSKHAMGDMEGRIDLNERCLEELKDRSGDFAWYRFELAKAAFKLTAGRCSNHAMRALDDVDEVTVTLPYADLAPHLTAYGKALLLDTTAAVPVPTEPLLGQLLRGALTADGKPVPVTMLVSASAGESPEKGVSGKYFYDRIGKPIDISGKAVGNTIELEERTTPDASEASARITLKRTPQGFAGEWANKTKRFDIKLAP